MHGSAKISSMGVSARKCEDEQGSAKISNTGGSARKRKIKLQVCILKRHEAIFLRMDEVALPGIDEEQHDSTLRKWHSPLT
eukprot:scaffold130352_cov28-Tisochrysis_lutea.AAC.1